MGTSNWQNLPFNIDALMKIAPERVLDIGVGYGRWGMLIHEFCDVWSQRIHSAQWKVRVEGIEAYAPNIEDFQRSFYDEIHVGDASVVLEQLPGRFDVILFGDVLEHFDKDTARRLLRAALDRSDYVMVNIPLGSDWPQEEMYGNPYEAHLSEWEPEEFRDFDLVREQRFLDFEGRLFGSFVLSRKDPKDLVGSLFSRHSGPREWNGGIVGLRQGGERGAVGGSQDARFSELAFELDFLKACRPVRRLFRRPNRVVRSLGRWRKSGVQVRALGTKGEASSGTRVALLTARSELVQFGLPWYFVDHDEDWVLREHPEGQYGRALVTDQASTLRFILRGHVPLLRFESGPGAGQVEVSRRSETQILDLYSPEPGVVEYDPKSREVLSGHATSDAGVPAPDVQQLEGALERLRSMSGTVLAVCVDGWLGVGSATRTLFEHSVSLPQNLSDAAIEEWSGAMLGAGVRHLVLSGVTPSHLRLAQRLRARDAKVRVDTVWHGSTLQTREDYAWKVFQLMVDAAREGVIHKLGFVKKGMEEWISALGLRSGLLLNSVPTLPERASTPDEGATHVGLWLSSEGYRKLPYAMIAAARMLPGVALRGAGLSRRAMEFVEFNGLDTGRLQGQPLPADKLGEQIRGCHFSLYVTLSECCPMLPLESMAEGVPCLVGPNSHLFEDDAELRELLVVPYPERAEVIAASMRRLLEAREQAVEGYRRWAPGYLEAAAASVRSFLEE